MKVIDRKEAAKRLGMTPNALSCHVYRKNWDGVPKPILIGGRHKWTEEQIEEWLRKRIEETMSQSSASIVEKKKLRPGRPRKTRSASCP